MKYHTSETLSPGDRVAFAVGGTWHCRAHMAQGVVMSIAKDRSSITVMEDESQTPMVIMAHWVVSRVHHHKEEEN